ncbi:hypothetical protein NESM_000791100 [Novymonas esmeraldas]|uniref:EGF-like domain-containing protein n=1 Tax=Novymonas esmeraldas TaxID=1808958 RepID=A0AAW0EZK8_9TRYP
MTTPAATGRSRSRALALLCAALALAAVLARADSFTISSDTSHSGDVYNGDTITLDLAASSSGVVTVQLANSQVIGSGLTIQSASGSSPSTRLSMSMASTTATQATIALSGAMPTNSDIRIVATSGTLAAAQSLFDFSGLSLNTNITIVVEDTAVTWPAGSASTGSVIFFSTGSNAVGISNFAAIFVLNATATNGASVVNINTQSSFPITNSAVLAIDYSRCESCTGALVSISSPLTVDSASLFRITNCTAVGTANGLLTSAGSVAVSRNSLYLVANSQIQSGDLFNFFTGSEDSSDPFPFTVSGGSTASFLNLVGPATGINAGSAIPSSYDATSNVIGGGCVINGNKLPGKSDYAAQGLNVKTVVNNQGADGNTCANANCVPANTNAGTAVSGSDLCTCHCTSGFNPPSCTAVTDPTQTYNGTATCSVPNCAACDRLYPTSRCTQCDNDYVLTSNAQCEYRVTTAAPTQGPTTAAPTCNVAYCSTCVVGSGSRCSVCRNNYKLSGSQCIANTNAAAGAHTAALAAAVCIALTVYSL